MPLLEGVRVIGGTVRMPRPDTPRGLPGLTFVLPPQRVACLELDSTPERVRADYAALLEQEGWVALPPFPHFGGFQQPFTRHALEYRDGEMAQTLDVSFGRCEGVVLLTLNLQEPSRRELEQRAKRDAMQDQVLTLPLLGSASNLEIHFSGGGGGEMQQHSSAYVLSCLPLEAIGRELSAQMAAQGCTLLETAALERTFVCSFRQRGERGEVWGSLVLNTVLEGQHSALLAAALAPDDV